ncbi:hypothetical protein L195_g037996 [Trifolium pratense]|uniref:Uncharacterized protein n=1 Tax=Trifolium pratense TaxID=57577 RepID=A0A2K3LTV4_TRIPR|nr:hypothetical protein L195_g037996 [Trifolium pratense]
MKKVVATSRTIMRARQSGKQFSEQMLRKMLQQVL